MKPVDQTTFGFPGGNCFSACVASLLELTIDDVPYFMGDHSAWFARFNAWLRPHGFYGVPFELNNEWRPEGLHILTGVSPRGKTDDDLHCVIADGKGAIVHDPHPSRAGIGKRTDVILFVPIDPACVTSVRP